jgi:hypothetical protein
MQSDRHIAPGLWLRITVLSRRFRFVTLLSRITGCSLQEAWRAFPSLPAPDGPWEVPDPQPGRVR